MTTFHTGTDPGTDPVDPGERSAPRMRADARRNYESLLAAARAAFLEYGIDTSLDDIAKRAGVANATLYRHFPTRQALLETLLHDSMVGLDNQALDLLDADAPGDALEAWLRAAVEHASTYRGLVNAMMASLGEPGSQLGGACHRMRDSGGELLRRAQASGEVRADTRSADLFALVTAVAWAREHAPDAAEHTFRVMVDGLRTAPRDPAGARAGG